MEETAQKQVFYRVFVRDGVSKVLKSTASFYHFERLQREGWQEVWDSAPSKLEGFRYAWAEYEALPEPREGLTCVICFNAPARVRFRGKKLNLDEARYYPFQGRLCEQCADDDEIFVGQRTYLSFETTI